MKIEIKPFDQLSLIELHDALKLRSEIFHVEQDCVYVDVDGRDPLSHHLLCYDGGGVLCGTLRIMKRGVRFDCASIGRVVVRQDMRGGGYGRLIMQKAVDYLVNELGERPIKISAQKRLKRFYEGLGFEQNSEEYMEDEIPHIEMIYR